MAMISSSQYKGVLRVVTMERVEKMKLVIVA